MSSEKLPKKIEKNIGMLSNVHIIVDFGDKPLEQIQMISHCDTSALHLCDGFMGWCRNDVLAIWSYRSPLIKTKTTCPSQGYQIYHKRDIDTIYFGIYSSMTCYKYM